MELGYFGQYGTRVWAGWLRGRRCFLLHNIQTGSGIQAVPWHSKYKHPGRKLTTYPPPSSKMKNACNYISKPNFFFFGGGGAFCLNRCRDSFASRLWDLRYSQQWLWSCVFSGMWYHVVDCYRCIGRTCCLCLQIRIPFSGQKNNSSTLKKNRRFL